MVSFYQGAPGKNRELALDKLESRVARVLPRSCCLPWLRGFPLFFPRGRALGNLDVRTSLSLSLSISLALFISRGLSLAISRSIFPSFSPCLPLKGHSSLPALT